MDQKPKFVPPCELCAHAAYFNFDGTWVCNAMCLPSDPVKAKKKCRAFFEEIKPENRVVRCISKDLRDVESLPKENYPSDYECDKM